ncbi:MAG: alpha/beta fold hydrolase [Candidatus Dormibacteraeota bacterium]|nr:alpha/beta fold hydrolase [Candidatus Dormibacteraeota bacterium]
MAVAYEVLGPERGAPVALVPGTFSDRRTWLKLAGSLAHSFRCLLFDPRGTGASPDPGTPFTPDDLVDDLLAAMDGARIQDAHLVGHSLGAVVALLAAARHPARVRRLVAIGPTAWVDARLRMVLDHWESVVGSDLDQEAVVRALVLEAFGREAFERLVPAVVRDMLRNPIPRETLQRYIDCDRRQDLRRHLGRIDAPVLVVAGTEDGLSGPFHARAVAEGVAGARLELVLGAGHTLQVERPAELARLVVPFLRGDPRRPAAPLTLEAGTER